MPVRTAYAGAATSGEVLTAANVNKGPGGWIGYEQVIANQGIGAGVKTDITGLAVTLTVPAGRRIRITGDLYYFSATPGSAVYAYIMEGATQLQQRALVLAAATFAESVRAEIILTPSAGTHTYKVMGEASAASTMTAAATYPASILVEDLGPAT